jgi:hypothetical protein
MPARAIILATVVALTTMVAGRVHSSGVPPVRAAQRDSLRVRIETRPASIRSRDTATVTVSVTSLGGGPVPNANLLLKASGGILHTGMSEVSGTTNRNGVLTTTFSCGSQCIPIYTITAQATRAGMVSGQATATIRGSR